MISACRRVSAGRRHGRQGASMNIFFDVDYTILGLDDSLRPGTKETFRKLIDDGHSIYIWSGVGLRWEVVRKHSWRSS